MAQQWEGSVGAVRGAFIGAIAGFAYGTQFDFRGRADWTALGAVASFLVAFVALLPIWIERRRRRRQTRSTRDHAAGLLMLIESLLDLRIRTPQLGPFTHADAAPIHELLL